MFGAAKGLDSSVRSWRGSLPVLNILDHQGSPKIITHETQKVANGKKHQDTLWSDQIRQNRSEFPALWESGGWGNCRDCAVQAVVAAEAQGAPEPRTNAHTAESSEVAHSGSS